jgi:hypothetical protein
LQKDISIMEDFRDQAWFHSMEHEAGRFVVYVKYMDKEVFAGVPDTIDGEQVVIHFAGAKLATREMFTDNLSAPGATLKQHVPLGYHSIPRREGNGELPAYDREIDVSAVVLRDEVDDLSSSEEDKSLSHLIAELDKLERQCGSNTLQDIFYEIHDGNNAVTEWSKRYPDVRKTLEKLYQQYGFDVIYEEMDG